MATLAANGGTPALTKPWPVWPIYGEEERVQLDSVLEDVHGADRLWSGLFPCPKASELESAFAAYHDCEYGVAVSTGAAALEVALFAIGLELGDEVITTPMSWVASATCILRAGGIPVFVDVEPETYALDPDLLEAAITPRTKAIIPVHLAGYPAKIDKIMAVAEKHGLVVIEDCAQAHGTSYLGRKVGSFGPISCFSFQNSKFMASGEGGMILTGDRDLWERCHSYKDCGRFRGEGGYVATETAYQQGGWGFGLNYRLSEFQAAVLLAQFERMEAHKAIRFANAVRLGEGLSQLDGIRPLTLHPGQSIWRFMLEYDAEAFGGLPLDRFIAAVQAEGVPLQHFPLQPLPQEALFRGYLDMETAAPGLRVNPQDYQAYHLPVAERGYQHRLAYLQQNVLLAEEEDMDGIVAAISKVQQSVAELA